MTRGVKDGRPDKERFFARVNKKGPVHPVLGTRCWLWEGPMFDNNYGQFWCSGESRAHRASYRLFRGDIPKGLLVCHHCDNHPCVRPTHLFLGTNKDNQQDMVKKGRQNTPIGNRHGSVTNPESIPRGEKHHTAKLTNEDVIYIRSVYKPKHPCFGQTALARRFGVAQGQIYNVIHRITWKHLP